MSSALHKFSISASRSSVNRLRIDPIHQLVNEALSEAAVVFNGKAWEITLHFPQEPEGEKGKWEYSFDVNVNSPADSEERIFKSFNIFEKKFRDLLNKKQGQEWAVKLSTQPKQYQAFVDSLSKEISTDGAKKNPRIDFDTKDVVLDLGDRFNHLFGLEDQIKTAFASINTALKSRMRNRYHIAAYGPPGCGKTDMTLTICNLLRETFGDDAVIQLDGTSLTEAGVAKLLDEGSHNPLIVMIEEIEKTNPDNLRWLLGLLDKRGQINRVNFHRKIQIQMNPLCICTVNNIRMFQAMHGGAIASRFPNKIYFPRPGRETLGKILEREVLAFGGKKSWIEPTLEFCVDELNINDPREIIPICISGGDGLLTGKYQQQLRNVRMNEERALELAKFCG